VLGHHELRGTNGRKDLYPYNPRSLRDVYGRGASEEIVGKALEGKRDKVVLATKAVARMGEGPNDWGASRYHLVRACEESLRRLRTDRIDLYYLHVVDLTTPMDEIFETLDMLVRQGKVLYVGTSKWPVPLIMEALCLSERCGFPRIVAEQPPYNILDRGIENELAGEQVREGGTPRQEAHAGGIGRRGEAEAHSPGEGDNPVGARPRLAPPQARDNRPHNRPIRSLSARSRTPPTCRW